MTTLEIVVIAVVVALGVLAVGGAAVLRRRRDAGAGHFRERLDQADRDLAAAHAADNGWEPARVQQAARRAFEAQRPGAPVDELALVQVIDPPGTDDDRAVFRVTSDGETLRLAIGRRGDEWRFEALG